MKVVARALLIVIILGAIAGTVLNFQDGAAVEGYSCLAVLALAMVFMVVIELLSKISDSLTACHEDAKVIIDLLTTCHDDAKKIIDRIE